MHRLENGAYNLSRTREMDAQRYEGFQIPINWMLNSGFTSQVIYVLFSFVTLVNLRQVMMPSTLFVNLIMLPHYSKFAQVKQSYCNECFSQYQIVCNV